jgi:hypothetical protein
MQGAVDLEGLDRGAELCTSWMMMIIIIIIIVIN